MGAHFCAALAICRETITARTGVTTCDSSKATLSVPVVKIAEVLGLRISFACASIRCRKYCILCIIIVHTINDSSVGIQRVISIASFDIIVPCSTPIKEVLQKLWTFSNGNREITGMKQTLKIN